MPVKPGSRERKKDDKEQKDQVEVEQALVVGFQLAEKPQVYLPCPAYNEETDNKNNELDNSGVQ